MRRARLARGGGRPSISKALPTRYRRRLDADATQSWGEHDGDGEEVALEEDVPFEGSDESGHDDSQVHMKCNDCLDRAGLVRPVGYVCNTVNVRSTTILECTYW